MKHPPIQYAISTSSEYPDEAREIYRPKTLKKAIARLKANPNTVLMRCVVSSFELVLDLGDAGQIRTRCTRNHFDPILDNEHGNIWRYTHTLDGDISVRTLRRAGIPWGKHKLSPKGLKRAAMRWRRRSR